MDGKLMREPEDARRMRELPEHEIDDERTAGGGILGEGGTAVDRGTGELGGTAQGIESGDPVEEGSVRPTDLPGARPEDDDPRLGLDDELDGGNAIQPRTG